MLVNDMGSPNRLQMTSDLRQPPGSMGPNSIQNNLIIILLSLHRLDPDNADLIPSVHPIELPNPLECAHHLPRPPRPPSIRKRHPRTPLPRPHESSKRLTDMRTVLHRQRPEAMPLDQSPKHLIPQCKRLMRKSSRFPDPHHSRPRKCAHLHTPTLQPQP
ncbi:hypothetical protein GCM10010198_05060 [Nocardia seriolae]|nr:hypothetical protein NSERKGN1266_20840 [Nocardia seriolae]BEK97934.1 hypothetical protein NSER024013_58400 [Nocardia seriolae]